MSLAPIATVEYLEASSPLASDHSPGIAIAQFYLANVPGSSIYFFSYQRRPL